MNMSKNKLFPLNSASDRLVTEIVMNDCKYMKIIDMNCGCRNEYVSDLHPLFRSLLQRSLSYLLLYPQFTYMIFIYFQALYYHLTGLFGTNIISCLVSSIGGALHQYRRGHGFKSRTGLNFFLALFSPLLKKCS